MDLLRLALSLYWAFMSAHPFLGVLLTLGSLGWIVSGVRALKGLPDPTPRTITQAAQGLAAGFIPTPGPPPETPEVLSRYDRLLSDD